MAGVDSGGATDLGHRVHTSWAQPIQRKDEEVVPIGSLYRGTWRLLVGYGVGVRLKAGFSGLLAALDGLNFRLIAAEVILAPSDVRLVQAYQSRYEA